MKKYINVLLYSIFFLICFTSSGSLENIKLEEEKNIDTLATIDGSERLEKYIIYGRSGLEKELCCITSNRQELTKLYNGTINLAAFHNGQILFYSREYEDSGLYLLNIGEIKPKLLLMGYRLIQKPCFSKDGSRIAFYAYPRFNSRTNKDSEPSLFYMDLDKKAPVKINIFGKDIKHISFINNDTILYTKKAFKNGEGVFQIYSYSISDIEERILFQSNYNEVSPIASPDGNKIAFLSDRNSNFNLYVYFVKEKNTQELDIEDAVVGESLEWSATGNEILYISLSGIAKYKVKLANTELCNNMFLAEGYIAKLYKTGNSIIYAAFNNGDGDKAYESQGLYKMDLDNMVSTRIWSFPEPGVFSRSITLLYLADDLKLQD